MNFEQLVQSIKTIHESMKTQAGKAVNVSLTIRNWLIGRYIAEYELNGADKASYGKRVFSELSQRLDSISNCNQWQLHRYIRFYREYPQILGTLSPKFRDATFEILRMSSTKSENIPHFENTAPKQIDEDLLERLSYSHLEKLSEIDDKTKRLFYQVECLRGQWSVKELKRQIGSLYYERSGLSFDKEKLAELARQNVERIPDSIFIRDPYVFEFLGLKPKEVMTESQLEDQLMDSLENFILELGHGFCFEARQKRILIGNEFYFIDMVFYNRILKCHVLIELKIEEFSQENIGQLNTYVSWYRKNMMTESDNPPVGILLCTGKNEALVEYALAGMDNNLFVSRYLLQMPKKEEMRAFIEKRVLELRGNSEKLEKIRLTDDDLNNAESAPDKETGE